MVVQVTRKELSDPSHRSDLVCFVLAQSYALYIYFSTVGRFTRILFFFFSFFSLFPRLPWCPKGGDDGSILEYHTQFA